MKIQINQWGNSLAVRIPKIVVQQLKLDDKSEMEMLLKDNQLILSKPRYSLEELVSAITPENRHSETSTGSAVGKEIW